MIPALFMLLTAVPEPVPKYTYLVQVKKENIPALTWAINSASSHVGYIVQLPTQVNPETKSLIMVVDLQSLTETPTQLTQLDAVWSSLKSPYHTQPGVFRDDWLIKQLLHDRYYDFMLFRAPTGSKNKFLNRLQVYATLGVNEKLAQQVGGDQRTAIFKSQVAGLKARRIDRIQGAGGRFNTGAVWQTWDIFDESNKTNQHPFYNLLAFNPDGGEAIFERKNGLMGGILYDANDTLVTEAPPNLVSDHTVPAPHTRRLVTFISCVRCHAEWEGIPEVGNDVQRLLKNGVDIIDKKAKRIAGLYAGDFTRRLKLGREDYNLATRRATKTPDNPQGLDVKQTSLLVSRIYGDYYFNEVTPGVAVKELGFQINENEKETDALKRVLPPLKYPNVVAAALRAGISVRREDWEQIYIPAWSISHNVPIPTPKPAKTDPPKVPSVRKPTVRHRTTSTSTTRVPVKRGPVSRYGRKPIFSRR